uniref:Integrase catalytic domain-containing protein n=1 Tax=Lactuca sativa TaxID=4236 RepID=A0A9R1W1C7_LACSA|nr:hypothetical protein LSAT_V11C400178990 [Lactuca sativa]
MSHGTIVIFADGHKAEVLGRGDVQVKFTCGAWVTLRDVLRVPTISKGLVSTDKFDKGGFKMVLERGKIVITKGRRYVGRENNYSGMYHLCLSDEGSVSGPSVESGGSSVASVSSVDNDHKCLAHTNVKNIEKMQTKGMLKYDTKNFEKYETCVKSKFTKKPFPSIKRNTSFLELIHSDICELNGILTQGGKRYFIAFCDDFSRYLHIYLLRSKYEAFDAFKRYKDEVENQLERHIKILRSDRGWEYFNQEFDTFCEENGIKHERTSPYTPQ